MTTIDYITEVLSCAGLKANGAQYAVFVNDFSDLGITIKVNPFRIKVYENYKAAEDDLKGNIFRQCRVSVARFDGWWQMSPEQEREQKKQIKEKFAKYILEKLNEIIK